MAANLGLLVRWKTAAAAAAAAWSEVGEICKGLWPVTGRQVGSLMLMSVRSRSWCLRDQGGCSGDNEIWARSAVMLRSADVAGSGQSWCRRKVKAESVMTKLMSTRSGQITGCLMPTKLIKEGRPEMKLMSAANSSRERDRVRKSLALIQWYEGKFVFPYIESIWLHGYILIQ